MADRTGSSSGPTTAARLAGISKLSCPIGAVVGRGAGRERAICQAVVDLLNELTYESVTMDAVAARAKASKATIYRRWANKDDLVVDALRRVLVDREDVVPDTGILRGDLIARINQQINQPAVLKAYKAAMKGLAHAVCNDPELAGVIRGSFEQAQLAVLQPLLDRAYARGELRSPVPASLAWEIVQGQFSARTSLEARPVDSEFVQHVIDDVLMPVLYHAGSRAAPVAP
jgi:AcrR family transcriptional regulator